MMLAAALYAAFDAIAIMLFDNEEIEEEDYYLENEMVECTSPQIEGKYYISLSAKVVPPLMGGDRDEAIQINMEVYNESFKGSTSYNGEMLIENVE